MTWSGNARPIPQIAIGIFDYVRIAPKVQLKAELSYGWFTDTKYQEKHVGDEHHIHEKSNIIIRVSFYVLENLKENGYLI